MTYLSFSLWFIAVAFVVTLIALLCRGVGQLLAWWRAALPTTLVLLVLTAVFDNLMIAAGLFSYRREALAGPHIGLAPIEDFAYPLVAGFMLSALWLVLGEERGDSDLDQPR